MFWSIAVLWLGGDILFAAGGDSSVVQFKNAIALSVDPLNNIYVLDAGTNEIIQCSRSGKVVRKIGGYGWQSGAFDQPKDIISPNGLDVYVADYGNHRILHFDRDLGLQSEMFLSSMDDNVEDSFGFPKSITYTSFGALYVLDRENNRIVKLNKSGQIEKTFAGVHGGRGALVSPEKMRALGTDRILVHDGNTIQVYDMFGNYVREFTGAAFSHLKTFAVDDKNLYVLDSCSVAVFDMGGNPKFQLEIRDLQRPVDCSAIVDFQVSNGTMYVLTSRSIVIQSIADASR